MFSTYLSNQMGQGPTPTPTPGLDSQAGLWGNKTRTFSGLWPSLARPGLGKLHCPHLPLTSEVVGGPSASRGHVGKGCTSWLPLLMAGFLGLHLRNCLGMASSLPSEQQPGVWLSGLGHLLVLQRPNTYECGLVTLPSE